MTKLKFTKKHAGWFIILTFVGTMVGVVMMTPDQILSNFLTMAAPLFVLMVILSLLVVAGDWITREP